MSLSAKHLTHMNISDSRKAAVKFVTLLKYRTVWIQGLGKTSRKDVKSLILKGLLDGYLYQQGFYWEENPLNTMPCIRFSRDDIGFVKIPSRIGN